ncbi:MAG: AAA family ATPase [Succinivibrio sp.]|nr:AAA family ATPase [Succinivibrio sp.]
MVRPTADDSSLDFFLNNYPASDNDFTDEFDAELDEAAVLAAEHEAYEQAFARARARAQAALRAPAQNTGIFDDSSVPYADYDLYRDLLAQGIVDCDRAEFKERLLNFLHTAPQVLDPEYFFYLYSRSDLTSPLCESWLRYYPGQVNALLKAELERRLGGMSKLESHQAADLFNPPLSLWLEYLEDSCYLDKTAFLTELLPYIDTEQRRICLSLPPGSGSTMAARTLAAYLSAGARSKQLFKQLDAGHSEIIRPYQNSCNTIYIDVQKYFLNIAATLNLQGGESPLRCALGVRFCQHMLFRALRGRFACLKTIKADDYQPLPSLLNKVCSMEHKRFVLIVDGWDYPLTRTFNFDYEIAVARYRGFLQELLGAAECYSLVVLFGNSPSGILRDGQQPVVEGFADYGLSSAGSMVTGLLFDYTDLQELWQRNLDRNYALQCAAAAGLPESVVPAEAEPGLALSFEELQKSAMIAEESTHLAYFNPLIARALLSAQYPASKSGHRTLPPALSSWEIFCTYDPLFSYMRRLRLWLFGKLAAAYPEAAYQVLLCLLSGRVVAAVPATAGRHQGLFALAGNEVYCNHEYWAMLLNLIDLGLVEPLYDCPEKVRFAARSVCPLNRRLCLDLLPQLPSPASLPPLGTLYRSGWACQVLTRGYDPELSELSGLMSDLLEYAAALRLEWGALGLELLLSYLWAPQQDKDRAWSCIFLHDLGPDLLFMLLYPTGEIANCAVILEVMFGEDESGLLGGAADYVRFLPELLDKSRPLNVRVNTVQVRQGKVLVEQEFYTAEVFQALEPHRRFHYQPVRYVVEE